MGVGTGAGLSPIETLQTPEIHTVARLSEIARCYGWFSACPIDEGTRAQVNRLSRARRGVSCISKCSPHRDIAGRVPTRSRPQSAGRSSYRVCARRAVAPRALPESGSDLEGRRSVAAGYLWVRVAFRRGEASMTGSEDAPPERDGYLRINPRGGQTLITVHPRRSSRASIPPSRWGRGL
jgi:hypothetical protein